MNIKKYWDRSKQNMEWAVAYRKVGSGSIVNDKTTAFKIFSPPKGTRAADPFLFSYQDNLFLFYELFEHKINKGVIAYSVLKENGFSEPKIIIDETYHLSFPCIFEHNGSFYIIPESGSQKCIYLYKCDSFPGKWHKECALVDGINSSDSIVFESDGEIYLLASVLLCGTGNAKNVVYKIDFNNKTAVFCCEADGSGENGFRNAGRLFKVNNKIYRPGQNCEKGEYGKSLFLYSVTDCSGSKYSEEFYSEITACDIQIENVQNNYKGIHTYSISGGYDVVDLKYFTKNNLIKRLSKMLLIPFKYLKAHFHK